MTKCACGCGKRIKSNKSHKISRIPKYINGHNWRGKKHTEETKEKISNIVKSMWQNENYKKMMSENHKGKRGYWRGKKRPDISEKNLGRVASKATLEKMSIAQKHRFNTEEGKKQRLKHSRFMKEYWKNNIIPSKGKEVSIKTRKKMSESKKRFLKTEKGRQWFESLLKRRFKIQSIKPNKPEKKLIKIIGQNNFPYKYVGDYSLIINGKCPDFVNCNGQKKLIELFGNYWHGERNKNLRLHQTEEGRKKVFSEFGFKTLVIWENELKDENSVIDKIRGFDNE